MKGLKLPDMRRLRKPDGRRLPRPGLLRLGDREWGRPVWLRVPEFDVPARLLVPGVTAVLLLFMGGLFFGNKLGSSPSAAGTGLIKTTVTIKGKVVTLTGKPVKVTVPARTVTRKGKRVRLPRRTITETQTQTHRVVRTEPTTVTRVVTKVTTVKEPVTTTVTTTVTVPST